MVIEDPPAPPPDDGRHLPTIEARKSRGTWTADVEPVTDIELRPPQRSFSQKMFSIGFGGWVRLLGLSTFVGIIVQASHVDPFSPDFSLRGAAVALGRGAMNLGLWMLSNGWMPLLIGLVVVVPLWLVWRLLSVPFRH